MKVQASSNSVDFSQLVDPSIIYQQVSVDEARLWEERQSSLQQANRYMFENRLICDVTFLLPPTSSSTSVLPHQLLPSKQLERDHQLSSSPSDSVQYEKVEAHRYVLCSRSPVFYAMFCGPLANNSISREIVISDLSAESFTEVLRFLYYDEARLTGDNVFSVLYGAKKYLVEPLASLCRQFLERCLSVDEVCTVLDQSLSFSEPTLVRQCMRFIRSNTDRVIHCPTFSEISLEALELIVGAEELNVEEVELFNACSWWGRAELKRRQSARMDCVCESDAQVVPLFTSSDSDLYRSSSGTQNTEQTLQQCCRASFRNSTEKTLKKSASMRRTMLQQQTSGAHEGLGSESCKVHEGLGLESCRAQEGLGSKICRAQEGLGSGLGAESSSDVEELISASVKISSPEIDRSAKSEIPLSSQLREVLQTILPHIQYETMTLDDIEHQVIPAKLLKKSEIEEIIRRIMEPVKRSVGGQTPRKRNKIWLEPVGEGKCGMEQPIGRPVEGVDRGRKRRKKYRGRSKSVEGYNRPIMKSGMSWSIPFQIFW